VPAIESVKARQMPMSGYVNIRLSMNDKPVATRHWRSWLPFSIVGVLVGFVLGFFMGQGLVQPVASVPSAESLPDQNQSAFPENHPLPEFIKQLQTLEQHAEEHEKDAQARVALGNAYYDMGRFDLAIRWYEEAMTLDDQDPDIATDLGTAYFYSGNSEKAIALFHHSLELEEDHPQTLQNLGWVQFQSDNLEAAAEAWERLLRVHPDYEQIEAVKKQLETLRAHQQEDRS